MPKFDPLKWGETHKSEFTTGVGQDYLKGELASIDTDEQAQEGMAWQEGEAGGLIGKFSTAGKIGAARSNAARDKASIIGRYNTMAAGSQENRDLTLEGQEFGASEAQKQRDFQMSLANLEMNVWGPQQEHSRSMLSRHLGEQGMWQGLGMGMLGQAASSYGPGGSADPFAQDPLSQMGGIFGGGGGGAAGAASMFAL